MTEPGIDGIQTFEGYLCRFIIMHDKCVVVEGRSADLDSRDDAMKNMMADMWDTVTQWKKIFAFIMSDD